MFGLLKLSKDLKKLLFVITTATGVAMGEALAVNVVAPEIERYLKKARKKSKKRHAQSRDVDTANSEE